MNTDLEEVQIGTTVSKERSKQEDYQIAPRAATNFCGPPC